MDKKGTDTRMNNKIEKLREWGCDIDETMKRMLNDEDFYLECLGEIPNDKYFDELGQALAAHDISAAFDNAHTLKGILANVGLTPMYKKIIEMVEPLRQGKDENLLPLYGELMKMKEHLSDIMRDQ